MCSSGCARATVTLLSPNASQLRHTEHDKYLNTLELFAYGTFGDYRGASLRSMRICIRRLFSTVTSVSSTTVVPIADLRSK